MIGSGSSGQLFVIAAPSGAGKTTLVHALLARMPQILLSVSHTTRQPRAGEVDGKHYHFVDEQSFAAMVDAGEFLEHAEVFGRRYGTARAPIAKACAEDRDVILEIDWQGARQVKSQAPSAIGIFILPPSLVHLRTRLEGRGSESADSIARRTAAAREELAHAVEFDYWVINQDFDRALDELEVIFRAARLSTRAQQVRHQALIEALTRA